MKWRKILCSFWLLTGLSLSTVRLEAQVITGNLVGSVQDETGAVLPGAIVRLQSEALLGGPAERVTNEKGQFRFVGLSPGDYVLDVTLPGFEPARVVNVRVALGRTVDRTVTLSLAGVSESVAVSAEAPVVDTHRAGLSINYGEEFLENAPLRRFSVFDLIKSAPGVSANNPSGGLFTQDVSVMGSGTNENAFLLDGTNFT